MPNRTKVTPEDIITATKIVGEIPYPQGFMEDMVAEMRSVLCGDYGAVAIDIHTSPLPIIEGYLGSLVSIWISIGLEAANDPESFDLDGQGLHGAWAARRSVSLKHERNCDASLTMVPFADDIERIAELFQAYGPCHVVYTEMAQLCYLATKSAFLAASKPHLVSVSIK